MIVRSISSWYMTQHSFYFDLLYYHGVLAQSHTILMFVYNNKLSFNDEISWNNVRSSANNHSLQLILYVRTSTYSRNRFGPRFETYGAPLFNMNQSEKYFNFKVTSFWIAWEPIKYFTQRYHHQPIFCAFLYLFWKLLSLSLIGFAESGNEKGSILIIFLPWDLFERLRGWRMEKQWILIVVKGEGGLEIAFLSMIDVPLRLGTYNSDAFTVFVCIPKVNTSHSAQDIHSAHKNSVC